MHGWNIGFDKVGLTLCLHQTLNYPLSRAKDMTDAVLRNEPVNIIVKDHQLVQITAHLQNLGLRFKVIGSVDS